MKKLKKTINKALFYAAAKFRNRHFLRLVRFAVNYSKPRFPKFSWFVMSHFDPNDIRGRVKVEMAPSLVRARGFFGENLALNVNDHIGWNIFVKGYFDLTPAATAIFLSRLMPGRTYVDIGANVGSTSIAVAKRGVEVVGIEASPIVFKELAANLAENSHLKYTPVNVAVTSESEFGGGYVEIYSPNGNVAASSLVSNWNSSRKVSEKQYCRLSTVDRVLESLGVESLSLVKIDIEGSEASALCGMADALGRRPVVMFEWRPDIFEGAGREAVDLRKLFPDGYQFHSVESVVRGSGRIDLELGPFVYDGQHSNVVALPKEKLEEFSEIGEWVRVGKVTVAC